MYKPKVLVFSSYYLPGEKSGGPVRTISNMLKVLGGNVDFYLITRAHDIDGAYYEGVSFNKWIDCEGGRVFYFDGNLLGFLRVLLRLRLNQFDFFYINSFFDVFFSVIPLILRRIGLYGRVRFVLAPRGEFSPGALNLKFFRKWIFLKLSNLLSLHDDITWQASSPIEKADIFRVQKSNENIKIAPDLAVMSKQDVSNFDFKQKKKGTLRVIFLSRISPMKNLVFALDVLARVAGDVVFDVYGNIEDHNYWGAVLDAAKKLPPNIRFNYRGVLENEKVTAVFATYDLMFLPTFGENYGHVIFESLAAGTPVLISDRTPWVEVSPRSAGWALSLECPGEFVRVLQYLVDVSGKDYIGYRQSAFSYAQYVIEEGSAVDMNLNLFRLG